MKLVDNAGKIAWKAYSVWGYYLTILCIAVPEILYGFWGIETNPYMWTKMALAFALFGLIGRLVDQGLKHDSPLGKLRLPLGLAIIIILIMALSGMSWFDRDEAPQEPQTTTLEEFQVVAIPLVAKWEGRHMCPNNPALHCAYLDTIARPSVWTIGYGQTQGVRQGDRWTEAEASRDLAQGLLTYRQGLHRYFTETTIETRLPPARDAAYVSLAWNVGVKGAGKSTATKRLNAGDIIGGCKAMTWWNKAGGRVVRGLVNRRADEYQHCIRGT